MNLRSLPAIHQLRAERVLLRLDLNVPIKGTTIQDDYKIISALPILRQLRTVPVIIISHRGEPKSTDPAYSLAPIVKRLKKTLGSRVFLATGSWPKLQKQAKALRPGQIMVLENLRFWPGEIKNSLAFAKELASLATIYINDAFAVSHRNHASVVAITKLLPSYAGPLLEKEVSNLTKVHSDRSSVVVLGGAKVSDKLPLIKKFLKHSKVILIGGGIANAFLKARGNEIGNSYYETKGLATAKNLRSKKIIMPKDVVVAKGKKIKNISINNVEKKATIYDIGTLTGKLYAQQLKTAKTIIWNGPLGLFEQTPFQEGTRTVAKAIVAATRQGAFSVVGGGETVAALRKMKLTNSFSWVSTGGGATISFLSGDLLPGLKGLIKTRKR